MVVRAVIFDWGGTLTPWHTIDHAALWRDVCAPHFAPVMTALGVDDPAACVFVGDRPYDDIHEARTAGMRAVLIPNSDVPPFEEAVPDAVIARLSELPDLLDRW